MTAITPARLADGLQEEEVRFRAPISESTWTRVGGSINFINERQYDTHKWDANGRFELFTTLVEFDGRYPVLFDMEVIGYSLKVGTTGISGTSTFDIHYYDTDGTTDLGTIFSTKPAVANTAADGSQSIIRLDPASDLALPTGHTKAAFSTTTFSAGEALEAQIDAAATGARNATLLLMYRPV